MRFGVFEIDRKTGELRKSGTKIRLQDQPFQVLETLLETPGELVTREQLRSRLWPDDTFVDFDHALTTAIKKLRRALNDSATQPRYIETLPKRGYRFIAPVEVESGVGSNGSLRAQVPLETGAAGESPAVGASLKRQRNVLAVGMIAAVAALALVGLTTLGAPEKPAVRRFSIEPIALSRRPGARAAISPNGHHIVYSAGSDDGLWVRDLANEEPRRLEGTARATRVFWAPDSAHLAFASGSSLKKISVHGGPTVTICDLPGGDFSGGAWSPDGETVVFSAGLPPVLYAAPVSGGDAKPYLEPEVTESGGGNIFPSFVRDGARARGLLFSAGSPADQEMVVADLAGGKRRRLGPGAYPLYHPAGFVIYQATPSEGGLWALPFSADRLEPTGKAFPVALQGAEPSLADDGSLVYVDSIERLGRQQLVWRDRGGARLGPIGPPQARIRDPALSPDGRFVAVEGSEEGNTDVWIHDTVEGTKSRLSYDPAIESNPIWHPSGRTVTYRFDRSGNAEIFERAADRSEAARALLATPAAEIPNSWTPDGRKLVYSVIDPATQYDIWMRGESAEEQIPLLVTRFNETAGQVSPDGRYLAYVSDESGQYEVYVREFPRVTRQWQVSTQGGAQPRWSHNGRELFYVDEGTLIAVEILEDALEFKTGARARLFESPTLAFRNPLRRSYDVSGDGSRFVMYELVEGPPSRAGGLIRVVENWDPTDSLSPER